MALFVYPLYPPIDPASVALLGAAVRGGPGKAAYALALLPLWSWILLRVTTPDYMDSLFLNPPSILGLPAGMVSTVVAMLLMALGLLAMRSAGSTSGRAVAFVLLTIPSLVLIVFAPAMIHLILNDIV